MNIFDFIKDASFDKKDLMRNSENDELAEKLYNPWITNVAFSLHADSIFYANEMNKYPHLGNREQYLYYINSLRPKKRFSKWPKKLEDNDIDLICRTYNCNKIVAETYKKLLSKEQMDIIKQEQKTGGM